MPHTQGLTLADSTLFISSPIDILLSEDVCADLLLTQIISCEKCTSVAINSYLGWLISGRIFSKGNLHGKDVIICQNLSQKLSLEPKIMLNAKVFMKHCLSKFTLFYGKVTT